MNEERLQKSEPMKITNCVRNYTKEYRIQQRTLGPQIAQEKQKNEADSFSQNPRPVFTGPVSQSVGFRTTLACFHWAVKSGRLSHNQGPVFTGPVLATKALGALLLQKKRKYTPITVGSKEPGSFKLSAAPLPPKKIVFGVGKLKSCVKEEILEHLETIGLTAAECVPVFKFSPTRPQPSTSDPSTKFRITIFKHQEMIFTNPENWPIGVEIHPWLFHARPQHLIKPTTTSLPNHYPVDLPNVNTPSLVNSHQHVENTVEVASILTSLEESTQPVEPVTIGPSQLVEPHKQQQASSMMSPPSENLLDLFTRQSSYYTTRDLLNILEVKYINNHDHPLPLLHINSRKTWLNDETAKLVRMNDYNFVFKNRSDRIGGGVGIFIRSGIEFSMINNLLLNDTIIDLLSVNLKFKIKQHTRKYFSSI
ncbi:hypothetical protein HELRODRAFT_183673 [Helobdella robusta]|uniref:Uncharacterized protein n=1 Tax=Helobdella robusta TaxID=6412 RepID=T1FK08_HELRO|nr:hypothetical protein HELRODRAFT_183673 [Helobdella robusta]ESO10395.1 hypothetical protein HELRODRAFT_183673 [Helobdella robusta]